VAGQPAVAGLTTANPGLIGTSVTVKTTPLGSGPAKVGPKHASLPPLLVATALPSPPIGSPGTLTEVPLLRGSVGPGPVPSVAGGAAGP
jgi:hypothetical protein